MKQLILVRHGEPATEGLVPRHDPPLSALGQRQAHLVGLRLAGEPIDRIVSSPLARAWQTAEPLADALEQAIDTETGVAEVDQDGEAYVSVEAWRAQGGELWDAFLDNPVAALGGDPVAFVERVHAALDEVLAGPGKRIAVFTHGLPINVGLALALTGSTNVTAGSRHGSLARFAPRHSSVTRLAGTTLTDLMLLSFNEATHIPAGGA